MGVFLSGKNGHNFVPISASILAVFPSFVAVPLIGYVLSLLIRRTPALYLNDFADRLEFFLFTPLSMSPLISWIGFATAVPVSRYLLRIGLAGWGIAILVAIFTQFLGAIFLFPDFHLWRLTILPSIVLALAYWLTLRLKFPRAFKPE